MPILDSILMSVMYVLQRFVDIISVFSDDGLDVCVIKTSGFNLCHVMML